MKPFSQNFYKTTNFWKKLQIFGFALPLYLTLGIVTH
jgi:hypothetical protein